jgi:hypothetical protein
VTHGRYPNLHSVWHVGSAYGALVMVVMGVWHQERIACGHAVRCTWLWGFFPVIVPDETNKQTSGNKQTSASTHSKSE